jgi:hypothetical protein
VLFLAGVPPSPAVGLCFGRFVLLEQVMGFGRFGVWLEVAAKVTAFVCSVVDGGGGEVGRPCLVWMDGVLCRGGVAGVDVKWWGDGG